MSEYNFITGYSGAGKTTAAPPGTVSLDGHLKQLLRAQGGDGSVADMRKNGLRTLMNAYPNGGTFEGAQIARFPPNELLNHNVSVVDTHPVTSSLRTVRRQFSPEQIAKHGFHPLEMPLYNASMFDDMEKLRAAMGAKPRSAVKILGGPALAIGAPVAAGLGAAFGTLNGGGNPLEAVQNGFTEGAHEATFGLFR